MEKGILASISGERRWGHGMCNEAAWWISTDVAEVDAEGRHPYMAVFIPEAPPLTSPSRDIWT